MLSVTALDLEPRERQGRSKLERLRMLSSRYIDRVIEQRRRFRFRTAATQVQFAGHPPRFGIIEANLVIRIQAGC